jgi:GNAT superfamily N-acetyltransferase
MIYTYQTIYTLDDVRPLQPTLINIYRAAYQPPPYNKGEEEVIEFGFSLPDYVARQDFRMVVASVNGQPVGFSLGYSTTPEHYWHKYIAGLLDTKTAALWLLGAFKFAEIALDPAYHRQGIGGQLHDRLLAGQPHRTAMLSTIYADTSAHALYKKRGWITLIENHTPPGMGRAYRTMGLVLNSMHPGA